MKKSIITEIFNGTKGHIDTMQSPRKLKGYADITKAYDELKENFNSEQMKLYEKITDMIYNNCVKEIDYYFSEGFKLGVLIGIECAEE